MFPTLGSWNVPKIGFSTCSQDRCKTVDWLINNRPHPLYRWITFWLAISNQLSLHWSWKQKKQIKHKGPQPLWTFWWTFSCTFLSRKMFIWSFMWAYRWKLLSCEGSCESSDEHFFSSNKGPSEVSSGSSSGGSSGGLQNPISSLSVIPPKACKHPERASIGRNPNRKCGQFQLWAEGWRPTIGTECANPMHNSLVCMILQKSFLINFLDGALTYYPEIRLDWNFCRYR